MPRFQKAKDPVRRQRRKQERITLREMSKSEGGNKYIRQMALHYMKRGGTE